MKKHLQTIQRWLTRIFLILACALLLSMAVFYWFLQRNPHELVSKYLDDISRRTGLAFKLGTVDVTLLPLPAIAVSDLSITGKDLRFFTAILLARPEFTNIVRGNLLPSNISLLRPRLDCNVPVNLMDLSAIRGELEKISTKPKTGKKSGDNADLLDTDWTINITNGQINLAGQDSSRLAMDHIHTQLEFTDGHHLDGQLETGNVRLYEGKKARAVLERILFSGKTDLANFLEKTSDLKIMADIIIPGHVYSTNFSAQFDSSRSGWTSKAALHGTLNLNGQAIPMDLSGRFTRLKNSGEISCRGVQWQLDADSGQLDALLKLPKNPRDFKLTGKMYVHRVSLTQWLGFARNLPPGLQLALDNVLHASLDFQLDAQALKVSKIKATCTGATFTGTGGVPDFSKPVVELDLKSPKANLGLAVPESLVKAPEPVYFPYPPFTPMPGKPLQKGETGIGYDIKLAADKLLYGPLTINKAYLRIYPGQMDVSGLEDVLLDAKAQFYEGSFTSRCVLGADPDMPCNISGSVKGVNGAAVAAKMPALPFRKGRFTAKANITSRGKTLAKFMANLAGPININGENVLLSDSKQTFTSLQTDIMLHSAKSETRAASFSGQWKVNGKMTDMTFSSELNGKLTFGGNGLVLKNIPFKADCKFLEEAGILPKNTLVQASGHISGQTDNGKFNITQLAASTAGVKINGGLAMDMKKTAVNGAITAQIPSIAKTLDHLHKKDIKLPGCIQSMKLKADLSASPADLRMSKIDAEVGPVSMTGSMNWQKKDRPQYEFNLTINKIDWEKDFATKNENKSAQNKKWDFKDLTTFDARGTLKIKDFRGWGTHLTSVSMPLELKNGKLSAGPATAGFCGSSIQGRATANFRNGLDFTAAMSAHDFNLEKAAEDRKLESRLTGKANVDANIKALLTGPGQIPAKLDGKWSFSARSGSWQGRNSKGSLTGKPTNFNTVSASGNIIKGVMNTSDITLKSSGLQVSGSGWINLESKKLDCNFNINMKNLPDFPLHLYGSLNNPKTSIGAGRMVINAITGITSGVVNVLGGMVQGVWNIFR